MVYRERLLERGQRAGMSQAAEWNGTRKGRHTVTNRQGSDPTNDRPQSWGGIPVFDAASQQIGVARDQDARSGFLLLEKGHSFPHDVEVPIDVVTRHDARGIYLSVTRDQIARQHWADAPGTVIAGSTQYVETADAPPTGQGGHEDWAHAPGTVIPGSSEYIEGHAVNVDASGGRHAPHEDWSHSPGTVIPGAAGYAEKHDEGTSRS